MSNVKGEIGLNDGVAGGLVGDWKGEGEPRGVDVGGVPVGVGVGAGPQMIKSSKTKLAD